MASIRRRQLLAATGAALASPLVRAQRLATARLGFLTPYLSSLRTPVWRAFFAAMSDRGWREGTEYVLVERETRGDPARALELAKDLIEQRVDLVLAISTAAAVAMKRASERVPVVTWCGYPVEAGLTASLSRPSGNITGVANYASADVWGKFVELLREASPGLRDLGVLWDYAPPGFPDGLIPLPAIEQAAEKMRIRSETWMVRTEKNLDSALSEIEHRRVEAIILTGGGIHARPENMKRIADVFIRRRVPAITDVAGTVFQLGGCLLAYSPNVPEILTRLADLSVRVLRGASPADLPFERPSRFDLAINLKTAHAMGFTVPQALLLRADSIVE